MAAEDSIQAGISESIDVYALARTSGRVVGAIPAGKMQRLGPALADASGSVEFDFRSFRDTQGRPAADLRLGARLRLACDRCGEPVDVAIDERAKFYFVPDRQALEAVPIEDVDEEPLVGSERFDLTCLIEDQVILALPMTPRHAFCESARPDDADLATEERRASPFAILGALKRRSN